MSSGHVGCSVSVKDDRESFHSYISQGPATHNKTR